MVLRMNGFAEFLKLRSGASCLWCLLGGRTLKELQEAEAAQ